MHTSNNLLEFRYQDESKYISRLPFLLICCHLHSGKKRGWPLFSRQNGPTAFQYQAYHYMSLPQNRAMIWNFILYLYIFTSLHLYIFTCFCKTQKPPKNRIACKDVNTHVNMYEIWNRVSMHFQIEWIFAPVFVHLHPFLVLVQRCKSAKVKYKTVK